MTDHTSFDSHVPIPSDVPTPTPYNIAPRIRKMLVEQSFAVPAAKTKSVRYALWWVRKHPDHAHKQFVTRTVMEDNVKVIRIWRKA